MLHYPSVPEPEATPDTTDSEAPPVLRSWRNVYFAVLAHLAAWILLLYLFTAVFRPSVP